MRPRATIAALYGNFSASILALACGSYCLYRFTAISPDMGVANGRFLPRPYAAYLAHLARATSLGRHLFRLVNQRFFAGLDLAGGYHQLGNNRLAVASEYGRFPTVSPKKTKFSH